MAEQANTSGAATGVSKRFSAVEAAIAEGESGAGGLKRSLGSFSLIAMGVAAVVGAGIFVVTGEAAATRAG